MPVSHLVTALAIMLGLVLLTLPFRRLGLGRLLGYNAAWAAIFGGAWLLLDRNPAMQRYVSEARVEPDEPEVAALPDQRGAELRVRTAIDGHWWVRGKVDGRPVRFLVDTGASDVVLSANTAATVGIDPKRLEFTNFGFTASGHVLSARTRVRRLEIGPIARSDVPVSILQGDAGINLLGMSYLRTLSGWRVEGDTLILVS
ncbi:MAG: TIGR02281 family clan AA aspartic protease [Sphingomonadaceae bacterium]|nr:TIGR02281 family clan AA aspartic protease [Sphingomonadaceae bacterium]